MSSCRSDSTTPGRGSRASFVAALWLFSASLLGELLGRSSQTKGQQFHTMSCHTAVFGLPWCRQGWHGGRGRPCGRGGPPYSTHYCVETACDNSLSTAPLRYPTLRRVGTSDTRSQLSYWPVNFLTSQNLSQPKLI